MAGIYPPQCGDYSLIVMRQHLTPLQHTAVLQARVKCDKMLVMASLWSPDTLALCPNWGDGHDQWLVMPLTQSAVYTQPAIVTWQQNNAAELDHQEATSGGHKIHEARTGVIPGSQADCGNAVATNFYWSWQPEPVRHPRSFPVYTCTPGVQMVPPGTSHQHCTSSCIFGNIHVFWNVLLSKQFTRPSLSSTPSCSFY